MTSTMILSLALLGATPDVWPGFLGAGASPIDPETIPLTWSPTEGVAWTAELLGKGQSSPVIWGSRAFVTSIEGTSKDNCQVIELGVTDGDILWTGRSEATQKVRSNYFQSRSAPTPVVDGDRVYAFFETGDVLAYSHAGERVWQRSLVSDYGEFEGTIGLAASPLQTRDAIVLLVDHEGPSYLIALDKQTGETRWQTERTSRVSFASPALVPVGEGQQIVCSSNGSVDGYDPQTGALVW
jgi:outer membrane protein assembly factor BamB